MSSSHSSHKRKASSPASSMDDDGLEDSNTSRTAGGSGSELVPSTKAGEPPVTKRTLQNRKAQREFRKRREARVKDLEERCRRFDQMGLEANGELQNMARRFKEQNEALKALLVRLGYGDMIAGVLENVGSNDGTYEESNGESSSDSSHRQDQQSSSGPPLQAQQYAPIDAPPGSVNPGMIDPSGLPAYVPQDDTMTMRWANGTRTSQWDDDSNSAHQQGHNFGTRRSARRSVGDRHANEQAPGLLSLSFDGRKAQDEQQQQQQQQQQQRRQQEQRSLHQQQQQQQQQVSVHLQPQSQQHQQHHPQSQHTASSAGTNRDGITPGTFSSLMGILGGQSAHSEQQQQNQSGGGGSAFLKNMSSPGQNLNALAGYGMAHRPHQNDALLNPNPIPFALNLSNEPAPEQSWWDRHGGGMFGGDNYLDDKANAVAQASVGQINGSQSPFDISAFLTTGHTPGGGGSGYNINSCGNMPTGFTPALASSNDTVDPLSQAGADLKNGKEPAFNHGNGGGHRQYGGIPTNPQLNPAEHIQCFLRALEHRAVRAGEQRGQPQHQRGGMNWMEMHSESDDSSASGSRNNASRAERVTPNAAYSRLTQHPAFLRTDVGELEELVHSIPAASIATVAAQGSGSGAPLEVEACALDGLLALLDNKARYGELKAKSSHRTGDGGGGGGGGGGGSFYSTSIKSEQ